MDWTKLWSKKYPILKEYKEKDMVGYTDKIRNLMKELKNKFNFSDQDAFLVFKDISYTTYLEGIDISEEKQKSKYEDKFGNKIKACEYIGKAVKIQMDRKLGSKHPKHDFIYPVNYGFVPNTVSGDNEELDAYVLGIYDPIDEFYGKCIAVIHRLDDNDDKLIVVPDGKNYTKEIIKALTDFQERYFKSEIIM